MLKGSKRSCVDGIKVGGNCLGVSILVKSCPGATVFKAIARYRNCPGASFQGECFLRYDYKSYHQTYGSRTVAT